MSDFIAEPPELTGLLQTCFPSYFENRSYYKQLPHLRLYTWDDTNLVGQVGLDHRAIRVGENPIEALGIIDLCVAPSHRGQGIAAKLLAQAEAHATKCGAQAMVLFADDHRLYGQAGYTLIDRKVTFLAIHDHRSLGVRTQSLGDCMMVKVLSGEWPAGPIDMLGYLF